MATKRPAARTASARPSDADAVEEFMRELDHPLKAALELVRSTILGASPEIAEGIKWNSPSFYSKPAQEYFATINISRKTKAEPKEYVRVILHQGAKVKATSTTGLAISDPSGLLEWLAKDRCTAKFHDVKDVKTKKAALQDIVRQWIALM